MQTKLLFLALILTLFACKVEKTTSNVDILFNSLGFMPNGVKTATILNNEAAKFEIISTETKKVVFTGKSVSVALQEDVNQTASIADFSEFSIPGEYYLETANGAKSQYFKITNKVYDVAFYTSMRAFYLWRCGMEVEGTHNGILFKQDACHLEDGYLDYCGHSGTKKDGTGGWHDAGDHGKYVVNAGITMGMLFMAWDQFNESLNAFNLDLPNTAEGFPDFLKELKWETDWLLKMQYADNSGKVSHKLTRLNFSGFIMANEDHEKRYFSEWGSNATANFVGIMAMAARYFKPYDAVYAQTCLDAALKSYDYLSKNPEYVKWQQEEFHTGGYQAGDADARIWAAAELWETTGDAKYLNDFELKILQSKALVDLGWDWGNPKNLGAFTYLLSDKALGNSELRESVKASAIAVADTIVNNIATDIYGRPYSSYNWGCNGTVARLSSNLFVAFKLTNNEKYKLAAEQILAHLFGRNYYGRSYVTGLGVNPPMFPHDRRSAADSVVAPWPGYIVGGGHTATDWVDDQNSFSHNEVAINWQAALVFNLAWFVN